MVAVEAGNIVQLQVAGTQGLLHQRGPISNLLMHCIQAHGEIAHLACTCTCTCTDCHDRLPHQRDVQSWNLISGFGLKCPRPPVEGIVESSAAPMARKAEKAREGLQVTVEDLTPPASYFVLMMYGARGVNILLLG
jgi:hypothetical protein